MRHAVNRSRIVCLVLLASSLAAAPELRAQSAVIALTAAAELLDKSGSALSSMAKGINDAYATIQAIQDAKEKGRETKRLGALSAAMTNLELDKWRFAKRLDRYATMPTDTGWTTIRVQLVDLMRGTRRLYAGFDADTALKGFVPTAATALLRALDDKGDFLQLMRTVSRPTSTEELAAVRRLEQDASDEVEGMQTAHAGFSRYICARVGGDGCSRE